MDEKETKQLNAEHRYMILMRLVGYTPILVSALLLYFGIKAFLYGPLQGQKNALEFAKIFTAQGLNLFFVVVIICLLTLLSASIFVIFICYKNIKRLEKDNDFFKEMLNNIRKGGSV